MNYVSAKQVKKQIGITSQTLYNWRKCNKIKFKQINKRKFVYDLDSILNSEILTTKKVVAYCRVSNTKQKDDLLRQEQLIRTYACNSGIIISEFLSEIASGMNEDRKIFNKLIEEVVNNKVSRIYITYKDRLTRFGYSYFEKLFKKFDCEIIVINATNETTFEQELTQDLISIIHHFSMKMYSNRRNKLKEMEKSLQNDNN